MIDLFHLHLSISLGWNFVEHLVCLTINFFILLFLIPLLWMSLLDLLFFLFILHLRKRQVLFRSAMMKMINFIQIELTLIFLSLSLSLWKQSLRENFLILEHSFYHRLFISRLIQNYKYFFPSFQSMLMIFDFLVFNSSITCWF